MYPNNKQKKMFAVLDAKAYTRTAKNVATRTWQLKNKYSTSTMTSLSAIEVLTNFWEDRSELTEKLGTWFHNAQRRCQRIENIECGGEKVVYLGEDEDHRRPKKLAPTKWRSATQAVTGLMTMLMGC